jgi:hypothetical protein
MTLTAIIAGGGALPQLLLDRLQAQGQPVVVAAPDGVGVDLPGTAPERFRIERLVPFLDSLADRGVGRVVMAGAVRRPKLEPELFDPRTAQMFPRILELLQPGDDGALRSVIGLFEDWGLTVVGAETILPDLLPPAGVPTRPGLPDWAAAAAALGEATVAEMGRADTGQACVIRDARVIAREGPDGTDAMLDALPRPDDGGGMFWPIDVAGDLIAGAADWLSGPEGTNPGTARAGMLFKAPKPGQDRRADLPLIGPGTAAAAARAHLAGIVVEAGGVMVLDLPDVVAALDGAGMFLWVRPAGGGA